MKKIKFKTFDLINKQFPGQYNNCYKYWGKYVYFIKFTGEKMFNTVK